MPADFPESEGVIRLRRKGKQCVPSAHQVVHVGMGVRGGGKPSQSFIVHENPERVTGGHQHVNPEVKLEPVDDEGLGGEERSHARTRGRWQSQVEMSSSHHLLLGALAAALLRGVKSRLAQGGEQEKQIWALGTDG